MNEGEVLQVDPNKSIFLFCAIENTSVSTPVTLDDPFLYHHEHRHRRFGLLRGYFEDMTNAHFLGQGWIKDSALLNTELTSLIRFRYTYSVDIFYLGIENCTQCLCLFSRGNCCEIKWKLWIQIVFCSSCSKMSKKTSDSLILSIHCSFQTVLTVVFFLEQAVWSLRFHETGLR